MPRPDGDRLFFTRGYQHALLGSTVTFHAGRWYRVEDSEIARAAIDGGFAESESAREARLAAEAVAPAKEEKAKSAAGEGSEVEPA